MGLLGVALICLGLCGVVTIRPAKPSVRPTNRSASTNRSSSSHFPKGLAVLFIIFGVLWCLSWAVGVVIWGGQDGATYVGIMWGVPLLMTAAGLGLAVHLRRSKDEQNIIG